MHRRKFLYFLTSGSTVAIASPYASALSGISNSSEYSSFIKMTGSLSFSPGEDVLNIHLKKISAFQTNGINLESAREWYSCGGTVFTCLRLENLLSENIDTYVLFYRKDNAGNWRYLSTYNSYQLKGICRLAAQSTLTRPADFIIPTSAPKSTYNNELCVCQGLQGSVYIKVKPSVSMLEINCSLLDNESWVIERYQSRQDIFKSLLA